MLLRIFQKQLFRATFLLKFHLYLYFYITVLSLVPSRVWVIQHYLQEFFTNFSKVFFEVTDIHSENPFVPFLILPNVLTENLQSTNRTHMPFSDSPCVLLTEISKGHVCVVWYLTWTYTGNISVVCQWQLQDIINCKTHPFFKDVRIQFILACTNDSQIYFPSQTSI